MTALGTGVPSGNGRSSNTVRFEMDAGDVVAALLQRSFTQDGEPLDVTVFAQANQEDPELGDWLRDMGALEVGGHLYLGGGAFALSRIERVA